MKKTVRVSELLNKQKVVPVVVIEDEEQASAMPQALLDGGVNVIEITLRHPFAIQAIELVKKNFPQMLVFAGTVTTSEDMRTVVDLGSDGIVSPGITERLANTASELNIAYLPGVATGSDILFAKEHGLNELKLFPATVVGGVSALKAFNGPFGDVSFCPTGGVSATNYQEFLALPNVMCVGGSWLVPSNLARNGDWEAITHLCKAVSQ